MKNFDILIDQKYPAEESIILRYHRSGITKLSEQELKLISLKEGERIFYLMDYLGVPIFILDETTLTETNTFEALVAAITLGHCKKLGYKKVIFSSGGNLGAALARYASLADIKAYSFNPLVNLPLLDGSIFTKKGVYLIGVKNAQKTRDVMLEVRKRMMKVLKYDPLIPKMSWRLEAFGFRGFFIGEYMIKNKIRFTAITQTISAGFGPIATFNVLGGLFRKKQIRTLPKLLGVQQEMNCYMYEKWSGKKVQTGDSSLLVPTLFDKNPDKTFGTYPALTRLLKKTGGSLLTISSREFKHYISADVLKKLEQNGLRHTKVKGDIFAKSGLVALAGSMKAIDGGIISRGPVLVSMTDGVTNFSVSSKPKFIVRNKQDLNKIINLVSE